MSEAAKISKNHTYESIAGQIWDILYYGKIIANFA